MFGWDTRYPLIQKMLHTVEPRRVDTPPLWTPHPCGHFLPGPFVSLIFSDIVYAVFHVTIST